MIRRIKRLMSVVVVIRMIGMSGSRLRCLFAVVAVTVALGGTVASADAAAPRLGRWEGRAGNADVVFTVEQNARHRRYVVRPVFYCGPTKFLAVDANAHLLASADAWPISSKGALRGGSGQAPFGGRFGGDRGTFTVQAGGPGVGFCPEFRTRFTARWNPAAPVVREGRWSLSVPPGNRPGEIPDSFTTFGEGSLIESTWSVQGGPFCVYNADADMLVGADGSFEETIPSNPASANYNTFEISGRFLSGGTATGTYTLTGPGCSGQPVAWTARLATPFSGPRPAGGSTRLRPPAPHERHIRYEIEVKSWIPQRKAVDPEVPAADTPVDHLLPSLLTGPRPICHIPRRLSASAKQRYLRRTRITSYFKGDGHRGFDGGFRVDMPLRFIWTSGHGISHFHLAPGRHVGTTHRLITQTSPHRTYHCVQTKTAPDTVGRNLTGADPSGFDADYSISEPLTKLARLVPIHVHVTGAVQANGALTLTIKHAYFPSGAVRVTANGRTVFTAIFNDASCVNVLGPAGAARLGEGLSTLRTDVFHVPPSGQHTPPPIRSPLC